MTDASNTDQLHDSPAEPGTSSQVSSVHSRRINGRELRLLGGMIATLVGIALIITTLIVTFEFLLSTKAWLLIAAAALITVGFMLIGSSLSGKAARLGEALFVAMPGLLLAAVGFTVTAYLQPVGSCLFQNG